jgi:hypothetical protein
MKIRPVGAEFFHANRRTDGQTGGQEDVHDKANSRFPKKFSKASRECRQRKDIQVRSRNHPCPQKTVKC